MKHFSIALLSACIFLPTSNLHANDKLEELVVVASRTTLSLREVASTVSVMDAEEIRIQAQPSLIEMLKTQPSVTASDSGGRGTVSSIRIRGEEGFRTLMLIDGMEITDPTGPQASSRVEHVFGSHFDRVEILRGPQAFIYGADAGGVVSIQTQRPTEEGYAATLHAEGGERDSHHLGASFAAADDTLDVFISADNARTAGFNTRTDDASQDKDGYDASTVHARAGWEHDEWRLQGVVRNVDADTEIDSCFLGFSRVNNCLSVYKQLMAKVSADFDGEMLDHHLGFTRSKINNDSGVIGEIPRSNSGILEKVEYLGHLSINPSVKLAFGGDFRHDERRTLGDESRRDQLGLFAEWQGSFDESLFLTGGLRYDDNQDFGEHISGRISAAYVHELNETTLKYRTSLGNGFRAPSLYEVLYNINSDLGGSGNGPNLSEETSIGAEVGVEAYFSNNAELQLTFFYQEITDRIEFDNIGFTEYFQDNGISRSHGVELSGGVTLSHGIEVDTGLMYNDTETADDKRRVRRPRVSGYISITGKWLEDRLIARCFYRTTRGQVDALFGGPNVELGNYGVSNISLQYDWTDKVNTFLRIENAGNEPYSDTLIFNTPERAAHAGIRLSL